MDTTPLETDKKGDKEIAKATSHIVVELIEYEHNEVVSKSILKKATGFIDAVAVADGVVLNESTVDHDTFVQIIEGSAHIEIDGKQTKLKMGEGILIPANKPSHTIPNGPFKLILTAIKSNY